MSPFRLCTAVVLIVALAGSGYSQTLDDYLFDAFCNREGISKLITTCYTPAAVSKDVKADGKTAYSAAPRGTFSGSGTKDDDFFTVIAEAPQKVAVTCTYPLTDSTNTGGSVTLYGIDGSTGTKSSLDASNDVVKGTFATGAFIYVKDLGVYTCSWKSTA